LSHSSKKLPQARVISNKSLEEVFVSTFHNKYQFSDFLSFSIFTEVKTFTIGNKTIYGLSKKLKAFQRFLNAFIFEYSLINEDVVYSYRKGKNTLDAIKPHASNKFFFQTDILNFYSNISQTDIEKVISFNLGNIPINDIDIYRNRIFEIVTIDGKLPIGFATSPLISNSCLLSFDNALQAYCLKHEITYTRYSDDLIFSTSNDAALFDFEITVTKFLNKYFDSSLVLNPTKTKHTHKGKKVKLLGLVILPTGRITIDIKVKRKVEALLHFYINDKKKFTELAGDGYEAGLEKISGQLNYINMIDPKYLDKLRKKYGNTLVDMFFHKSVK